MIALSFLGMDLTNTPLLYIPYILGMLPFEIVDIAVKRNYFTKSYWMLRFYRYKLSSGHVKAYAKFPFLYSAVYWGVLCISCGFQINFSAASFWTVLPLFFLIGIVTEPEWEFNFECDTINPYNDFFLTLFQIFGSALLWELWLLPLCFIPGSPLYGIDTAVFAINLLTIRYIEMHCNSRLECFRMDWSLVLLHLILCILSCIMIPAATVKGSLFALAAVILSSVFLKKR